MMDNHTSLTSCFIFENTNGSIYPNDLVSTMIEDASSSPPNSNGSLSPSSSNQSLNLSSSSATTQMSFPCCVLRCRSNSHPFQERCIPLNEHVKVGRAVARIKALSNNAIFDCKVLSRQHAKLWYENGKFFLQDTKSSNGTFVNNQRLGKCNEESLPFELFSDDIIQFGVDVTENNRKTTHNCIITEIKLFHTDGIETLPRSANGQSLAQIKELDINSQTLYQLAQYLQEAMHREQMLEQKLEYLQGVLRDTQQASNEGWQAIIDEDRLLARINALEDQIRIYHTKHPNEDTSKQELVQLTQSHVRFEEESKDKLEKALRERADAISRSKSIESSLQLAQDELKRFEDQTEQQKQDIQQLVQSFDEQRSAISELELKLQDSQTRCTELENEKQRIQTDFDEYYQRTHHLEEQKPLQTEPIDNPEAVLPTRNGTTHGRFHVESSAKDNEIPIISENGEIEQTNRQPEKESQRQTIIAPIQIDSVINHNHKDEEEEKYDNIDKNSTNQTNSNILEAQEQINSLRENLNQTNERLVSTEDSYRSEQERYRLLTSEYESTRDELVLLKIHSNKDKNVTNELIDRQQNELDNLSKSVISKQNEHDQLLNVYLCFFLSCYLLIFFLFFFLLSW